LQWLKPKIAIIARTKVTFKPMLNDRAYERIEIQELISTNTRKYCFKNGFLNISFLISFSMGAPNMVKYPYRIHIRYSYRTYRTMPIFTFAVVCSKNVRALKK